MVGRVQAVAAALAQNVSGSSAEEAQTVRASVLRCAAELPVHAPLLGVMCALMAAYEGGDDDDEDDDDDDDEEETEGKQGEAATAGEGAAAVLKAEAKAAAKAAATAAVRDVAQSVASAAASACVAAVGSGQTRKAKHLLTFLASLCASGALRVSGADGFMAMLQALAQRTEDGPFRKQAEQDGCAVLVLTALLACGPAFAEQAPGDLASLLGVLELHVKKRKALFATPGAATTTSESAAMPLCALEVELEDDDEDDDDEGGSAPPSRDNLDALWRAAEGFRKSGFSVAPVPRHEQPRCWCWNDPDLVDALEPAKLSLGLQATSTNPDDDDDAGSASRQAAAKIAAAGMAEDNGDGGGSSSDGAAAADSDTASTAPPAGPPPLPWHLWPGWHARAACLVVPHLPLFDARCGPPGAQLASLPLGLECVLRELSADVLAAFAPVVRWNGVIQGSHEVLAKQLLGLKHQYSFPSLHQGGASKDDDATAIDAAMQPLRADYLIVETLLALAVAPPSAATGQGIGSEAAAAAVGQGFSHGGCSLRSGGSAAVLSRALLEVCKADEQARNPIAVGLEVLWQRLALLDDASSLRAADLLAHYLNNTSFRWPFWRRWAAQLQEEDEDRDDDDDLAGGGGGGGGTEELPSLERRFLRRCLGTAASLNHSSSRLEALLRSKGAELPPPIAAMLPPALSPNTPLLGPGGSGGGDAMDLNPHGWWRGAFPSESVARLARDVRDQLSAQLDAATRRRLMAAEQGLAGPLGGAPSTDASALAAQVEVNSSESAEEVANGDKPPHWRVHAVIHGLLAAGAASEMDLTLALGNTLALADAHTPLLKRLLAVRTTPSDGAAVTASGAAASEDGDSAMGTKGVTEEATATMKEGEGEGEGAATEALEPEVGPGAYGVLLDAVSFVWAETAPSLAAALVLALSTRGLVPPDKALAWMGDSASALHSVPSEPSMPRAGALSLKHGSSSHTPLELATDLMLAAAPFAFAHYASSDPTSSPARAQEIAKDYLGDCAVAALDPLASFAIAAAAQATATKEAAGKKASTEDDEDEDDDDEEEEDEVAALQLRAACGTARAVVRAALSVRVASGEGGLVGGGPLLDRRSAASVKARVLTATTPPAMRAAIELIEAATDLY